MIGHRKKLRKRHYLYVDRDCAYDGPAIAEAMGSAFGEVFGFLAAKGIEAKSPPISVYIEMGGDRLRFRGGAMVLARDARKAEGMVHADTLPGGEVMTGTHVGSYAWLGQSHRLLWDQMTAEGMTPTMPVWEVYIDDPMQVPEAELRTEIYRAIG